MAQVEMTIDSVRRGLLGNQHVVILKEKLAERYLPIYIDPSQADVIKRELMEIGSPRPAHFDLSLDGVDIENFKPVSVIINRFEDNIFYAKLLLKNGNESREVECLPAEALAFGIRKGLPILVEAEVLDKAGIDVDIANKVGDKKN